jgi:dienelactone hydrolase
VKPEHTLLYAPVVSSGLSPTGRHAYAVVRRSRPDGVKLVLQFLDLDEGGVGWREPAGDEERVAPAIAPDGDRWAALQRSQRGYRVAVGRLSELETPPTLLPCSPHRPRVLKWSHDGTLACLGDDERGAPRVWRWSDLMAGGGPDWLTAHQHPVVDYALHPSKPTLAWLDRARPAHPFEEGTTALHLGWFRPRKPLALPCPGYAFGYLSWSPDGRWLALQARPAGEPLSPPDLWRVDPWADPGDPAALTCLTEGLEGALGGYDWAPDSQSLVAAVERGVEGRLVRLAPGSPPKVLAGDDFLSGPRFDRRPPEEGGGRMIYLRQSDHRPQRLCLREPGGGGRAIGRFSRTLEELALRPGRTLRWTGEGGLEIEGVLVTPAGEGPWPLIVWAHGGPAHHISRTFSPYFQVLAGAGYAVLAPNYRGSTGRGGDFCRASVGALTEADTPDLRGGVDLAVAEGVADPERVGVMGWSYGGALAMALARDDARVKAVVAGAPVADWIGLLGASNFPTTAWRYVGGAPWEDRATWDAASPVSWVERLRAPTLLLHGTEDAAVPFAQSLTLYRLLLALGVPCELAWYRGEGHTFSSPVAVVDMLRQVLSWFARYLLAPRADAVE